MMIHMFPRAYTETCKKHTHTHAHGFVLTFNRLPLILYQVYDILYPLTYPNT